MKRVTPQKVMSHRIELVIESNRKPWEVIDLLEKSIWGKFDRPGEDAYILYIEEEEPENDDG